MAVDSSCSVCVRTYPLIVSIKFVFYCVIRIAAVFVCFCLAAKVFVNCVQELLYAVDKDLQVETSCS